jgi:CheY-like chemotaxis protein
MPNSEVEILLVEDSELDAEITIRALRKGKLANGIVHLSDGRQALDFLFGTGTFAGRNTEKKPKLIMLDLKMPKVDGIEVLEKIKSDAVLKKIPVVVLTSSKENPDIEKCYDLGVNSYIVKPVGFDDFMNAISQSGMYWMLINQPPQL